MRYTTFYTIKELDYKTIESRLLNEKISSELKNEILHLIADHKAMIECRKKIIEDFKPKPYQQVYFSFIKFLSFHQMIISNEKKSFEKKK